MIGIFDSGVGGLTVLSALRQRIPSADVLYFGDVKNAPYGSRSREELTSLTLDGIKLLHDRGATNIISACNSVSASLAMSVFDALSMTPTQMIEMVGPTVGYFRESDEKLFLCATPATISSQIYQNGFRLIGKDVICTAIEELAGAIEFGAPESEIETIIRAAFHGVPIAKGDTLILGCTHYPIVLNIFERVLPGVFLFDPANAVADRAERLFWPQEAGDGTTKYLVSQDSPNFRALVERFFPNQLHTIEVLK